MSEWKEVEIIGISAINKFVAEFQVWEIETVPTGKFKVKIFENKRGSYKGFTNVGVVVNESPEFGVGSGNTIEMALEDTIKNFLSELNDKKNSKSNELADEDFVWADPNDF
ncbi:hypothetical protein IQ283_04245 [Alkalihalobacillus hwajinpoensis]|uniref:hypothetical protein n=1 Tax=Guptibacillus hwajinpoensis TaxID=208199 RepID=UPI0018843017|nr:hypothetical protein [Pseudalkalibacillus hwajinpoensis]MBF0705807.1 hypothetical protein [Pseudalkalibacillus hwajinpoensis]